MEPGSTDATDPSTDPDARHEGASFEPVPSDPAAPSTPTSDYPPEADPDKAGDLPAAEVAGEQTDPDGRLTGGDQTMPGSDEPPD